MGSIPAGSTKPAPLLMQGRGLGISIGAKLIHVMFESSISAFVKGRSQTDVFVLGVFRGKRGGKEGETRE